LCGGFGGARFAPGIVQVAGPEHTTVITNPGDDVRFLGLEVWPDFDSVLYALAGRFDEELGWGRRADSTACAEVLAAEGWFRMGDRDIALSLLRTAWLAEGLGRATVARRCGERLGVTATVVPASAQPHRTMIETDRGWHELQEYLVRRRAMDPPTAVRISPQADAATAQALDGLSADVAVLGPSNPVVSLWPILTTPGIAPELARAPRVVAVSPVVDALAPRTQPEASRFRVRERLLAMLGVPHTADGVARLWGDGIDGFVLDYRDEHAARRLATTDLSLLRTDLLPDGDAGRTALAREVLDFGLSLPPRVDRPQLDLEWQGHEPRNDSIASMAVAGSSNRNK
jgi:LPPG:FO 2-phospho-L-lactate transferase